MSNIRYKSDILYIYIYIYWKGYVDSVLRLEPHSIDIYFYQKLGHSITLTQGLFMVITIYLVQAYKIIYEIKVYYRFNVSTRVRKSVKLN